ncbi:MAG TPA: ATP-binding protein [Bryobacteraceae bacterium]|nr:ATP-binding protein [Bryobacteraceae bacterium]
MTTAPPTERGRLDSAAPEAVDRLCSELRTGLLAGLPARERFIVELLVREALMNSVAHGSGGTRRGEIHYEIGPVPGGMMIRVTDDGSGFDWRGWQEGGYQPLAESGRGLHIFHLYAHRVQFFGNGNRVELIRIFAKGELSG